MAQTIMGAARRTAAALGLGAAVLLGASAAAQAEDVRFTVAYYSAATGPYFEKMAKEFEAKNPGIHIKIDVVNWDNLLQKLTTDIQGNDTPDLSIIGTRWLVDFVKNGVVEPLDSYMNPAFKDRFFPTFLNPSKLNGKIYGLPIAASARALYYNKTMFDKIGMPDGPKTWDDVRTAAAKISADGKTYGFGLQGKEIETDVYWYYALWSFGGDVIGKDGKAAFDSKAGIDAATFYKSLVDNKLTEPGPTAYNREDVQNLFKQGRVAMVITAPFLRGQIAKEAPNLKYGIAPVPEATKQVTYGVTDSVVMFKKSKVKKAAWKFLDFLFTKDPRIEFTKNEGFLPVTKAEAADPYFANDPQLQAFVKLLPKAKFAPNVQGWEGVADAVTRAMQQIYLDKATPAAALKTAAAEANKALAGK